MNYEELKQAMADLDEDKVLGITEDIMKNDPSKATEAIQACQDGMEEVGRLFETGEYFVGDLIYAGEIMVSAMDILRPALAGDQSQKKGKMILCTVKNDLHDIGKNIVKAMLEAAGFEVLDLGVDTPKEKIVETAKTENIKIVALSGVLTLAIESMKEVVEAFKKEGMDDVKIIIGGNPVSENVCKNIGADEWAHSPQKTVDVCRAWAE